MMNSLLSCLYHKVLGVLPLRVQKQFSIGLLESITLEMKKWKWANVTVGKTLEIFEAKNVDDVLMETPLIKAFHNSQWRQTFP
jgi:hypothetical protein